MLDLDKGDKQKYYIKTKLYMLKEKGANTCIKKNLYITFRMSAWTNRENK